MQKPLAAPSWPGVTDSCSSPVNTRFHIGVKGVRARTRASLYVLDPSVSLPTATVLLQILLHDPFCDLAQQPPKVPLSLSRL